MNIEEKLDQIISILLKIEASTSNPGLQEKSTPTRKPKTTRKSKKQIHEEEATLVANKLMKNHYMRRLRQLNQEQNNKM